MAPAALRGRLGVPAGTAAALGAVAIASLLALAFWGASPTGRFLEHHAAQGLADPPAVTLGAFVLAWLLMTTATMLPTAAPLVAAFARMTEHRPDRTALTWCVVGGFTMVWAAVGVAAGMADVTAHWVVDHTSLHHHPHLLAANGLAVAGLYQLSPLAARCARACRSPMSFFGRHWTGRSDARRQALRIGAAYGASCLGCCASLMVVMLGVGMGNLAWMLGLGAVAAACKHPTSGERIRIGAGLVLLLAAVATTVRAA
jgi:predicted metal-binding membrane protein